MKLLRMTLAAIFGILIFFVTLEKEISLFSRNIRKKIFALSPHSPPSGAVSPSPHSLLSARASP